MRRADRSWPANTPSSESHRTCWATSSPVLHRDNCGVVGFKLILYKARCFAYCPANIFLIFPAILSTVVPDEVIGPGSGPEIRAEIQLSSDIVRGMKPSLPIEKSACVDSLVVLHWSLNPLQQHSRNKRRPLSLSSAYLCQQAFLQILRWSLKVCHRTFCRIHRRHPEMGDPIGRH